MPDNDPKTLIIERLTRENEQLKLLVNTTRRHSLIDW